MIFGSEQPRLAMASIIADLIIDYTDGGEEIAFGNKKKGNDDQTGAGSVNFIHNFFHKYITKKICLSLETFSHKDFDKHNLTRYLTSTQRAAFNKYRNSTRRIIDFIIQLQTKGGIVNIAEDITHYQEYSLLALVSYMNGYVTQEQVTSICLLYQAIDQFIVNREVCLNYSNSTYVLPVPQTNHLPKLQTYSIFENSQYIKEYLGLEDLGIERLLERLKCKPDSEQYYHTIEMPEGPVLQYSTGHQRLIDAIGFLHPVEVGESNKFKGIKQSVMVIPSYSMLLERTQIMCKDRAISYVSFLGEGTKELITHFKLQDLRPFQVGTSVAPVPKFGDGQYFGTYSFSMHDYYHGETDSWVKLSIRRAICYIHEFIFSKPINEKTKEIKWALMDGELLGRKGNFGHLLNVKKCSWDLTHITAILTSMALLADFWENEFFVTADQLLPEQRAIYDKILPTVTKEQKAKAEIDLFNFYKTTIRLHDSFAHFRLGRMYFDGTGTKVSYKDAFRHWQLSGNSVSLRSLAAMYKDGIGVKKDLYKALEYYLSAADAGHPQTQFEIGSLYDVGDSNFNFVKPDPVKALKYYTLAGEGGHINALRNLALLHRSKGDLDKFIQFFQRASELGDCSSQLELGNWYFYVKEEFSQALKYYGLAAEQGNGKALYCLGEMYATGKGVEVNTEKSITYFRLAAKAGSGKAQFELGMFNFTLKNFTQALHFFALAAEQGHVFANHNAGYIYKEGQSGEKNIRKAFTYFKRAADGGDEDSQNQLGVWYYYGEEGVVEKDLDEAERYFTLAAKQGHSQAKENLRILQSSKL